MKQVIFLAKFSKDIDKLKSKKLKASIREAIEKLENTNDLEKITNLKKLNTSILVCLFPITGIQCL